MEQLVYLGVTAFIIAFFVLLYLSTSKVDGLTFWQDTVLLGICSLACLGSLFGAFLTAILASVTFSIPLHIGYIFGGLFFIALGCFAWWRAARSC